MNDTNTVIRRWNINKEMEDTENKEMEDTNNTEMED
jgi:hypothetical protein